MMVTGNAICFPSLVFAFFFFLNLGKSHELHAGSFMNNTSDKNNSFDYFSWKTNVSPLLWMETVMSARISISLLYSDG